MSTCLPSRVTSATGTGTFYSDFFVTAPYNIWQVSTAGFLFVAGNKILFSVVRDNERRREQVHLVNPHRGPEELRRAGKQSQFPFRAFSNRLCHSHQSRDHFNPKKKSDIGKIKKSGQFSK